LAAETNILIGDSGGQHVLVRALSRSHPNCSDYWDGNWIDSEVRINVGGFRASYRAALRSEDFYSFGNEIKTLSKSLTGTARFETLEQQLAVSLSGDGRGHISVNGEALDQAGVGNKLHFQFEIDQTYLPRISQSVESLLTTFPVLGSTNA
jgi:hypothetical protein